MYNILQSFINHVWDTGYNSGDQAYLYAFSCIFAVVMLVVIVDAVFSVFDKFLK